MSQVQVILTNDTATEAVPALAGEAANVLRLTATNRHATVPSSLIVLDDDTEIARYHLAPAGGQINLGTGNPAFPVYPPEKHRANKALKLKSSVSQDGMIIDLEYAYKGKD